MAADALRQAAYRQLLRFEKPTGDRRLKAEALLGDVFEQHPAWFPRDRAFFTALFYGTLRQWFRLGA